MSVTQDKAAINRMLQSHGLPTLESGSGLMAALGLLVQDHEHLRSLLVRCEPENRRAMYDSLKPYLRFTPKPLDVYIAESAERAANPMQPTDPMQSPRSCVVGRRNRGVRSGSNVHANVRTRGHVRCG